MIMVRWKGYRTFVQGSVLLRCPETTQTCWTQYVSNFCLLCWKVWAGTRILWGPEAESKSFSVSHLLRVQIVPSQKQFQLICTYSLLHVLRLSFSYSHFQPTSNSFPLLQLATEIPNISQRQLCWTRWKLNTCATCKDFTYAGCKSGVSGYFSFIGELIWLEDTEISHVQDCFISLLPVATDSIFSEPGWLADQQGSPAAQFRKRMSHTSMAASACEATRAQIKSKARWTHFVLLSFDHSSFWHLSTNQVRTSVGCIVVNLETKWNNKYNFYQISCFEPQGIIRLSQGNPIANSASTLWATFLNSWGLLQKLQNLFRDALVCFAGGAPN